MHLHLESVDVVIHWPCNEQIIDVHANDQWPAHGVPGVYHVLVITAREPEHTRPLVSVVDRRVPSATSALDDPHRLQSLAATEHILPPRGHR
jgi:hypothetical protein